MTKEFNDSADVVEQAKPENSTAEDLDMARIQASMQGLREQQARELGDDVASFENRPKPPYHEDSPGVDEGVRWEDKGIVDVRVADLPKPDGVNGPEDFDHHISYPDAVRANERLQEMKPQIDSGFKSDDFAELDKQNGLDYANGQQRIYDLYYGSDPITLDKDGQNYDIVSGRHRVFVAQESGTDFIPARVKEKTSGNG